MGFTEIMVTLGILVGLPVVALVIGIIGWFICELIGKRT